MTADGLLGGRAGRLRVKVCCIASIEEADQAMAAGADAIGLVSAMPSGPGIISDELIARVIGHVARRIATVLLTSSRTATEIGAQLRRFSPAVVQIVDAISRDEMARLRDAHPEAMLMPVVHVRGHESVAEAVDLSLHADALLLDSGNTSAKVKELGGTGRVHDWAVSRLIRDSIQIPLFLAGGLRVSNVSSAVDQVAPFGVDVCSGVRHDGQLDVKALASFIELARRFDEVRSA